MVARGAQRPAASVTLHYRRILSVVRAIHRLVASASLIGIGGAVQHLGALLIGLLGKCKAL